SLDRPNTLVDIYAYCLMPNHFHLGLFEKEERGIEKFMKKLKTAYTMYYNLKYSHPGTIFQGKYQFRHVHNEEYLQRVVEYIHVNPFCIARPELTKEARLELRDEAIEFSKDYKYSSFADYLGEARPENSILYKVGPCTETIT
ncbi:MAG: transposase, partial [Patescibacteria group bacterium]|nr:transposase [Patescibacteria group bacterium]